MKTLIVLLLSLAAAAAFAAAPTAPPPASMAASSDSLKVGDMAPDFTLPWATRDSVSGSDLTLSKLYGKGSIVLAFYPADWSGGCTKEMCSMRDNFSSLSTLNAQVLGISGDYQFAHHEWAKDLNLPFPLVSDHLHKIAARYSSYYDQYGMNKRTVYALDRTGRIAYIDMHYSPRDSVSLMKLQTALKTIH